MSDKKQKPKEMLLFRCPHCGRLQLVSVEDIVNFDQWECETCKRKLKLA